MDTLIATWNRADESRPGLINCVVKPFVYRRYPRDTACVYDQACVAHLVSDLSALINRPPNDSLSLALHKRREAHPRPREVASTPAPPPSSPLAFLTAVVVDSPRRSPTLPPSLLSPPTPLHSIPSTAALHSSATGERRRGRIVRSARSRIPWGYFEGESERGRAWRADRHALNA